VTGRPAAWRYGNVGGHTTEIELVRAVYDAFAARDLDEALRHVDEDLELHAPGTAAAVGRSRPYRGHDGLREYFADVERIYRRLEIHADDIRTTGVSVVVFGHVELCVDDEVIRRSVLWAWKVRDGKVVGLRVSDVGPYDGA